MLSREEILNKTKYIELFSDNKVEAKSQFREYCKKYHPDADSSPDAEKVFSHIHKIYLTGNSIFTDKHNGITNITFRNKNDKKGFQLDNAVEFTTSICHVYNTATKVVFVYNKTYKKFWKNYLESVKALRYADSEMEKVFKRIFPDVVKSFETEDDNYIILINKTSEVLNLGEIVKAYDKLGKPFPEKQAVWILNRLYNIACYNKYITNTAFNGFALENLWISPEMHSILPLGGYEYTAKLGEPMIGVPKEVYKVLPIKVKDSKKSSILTDLESIKAVGRILYKEHDNLEHINKFLKSGISSDDPVDEWKEYGKAVKKQFGKRAFIVWEDVPYTK